MRPFDAADEVSEGEQCFAKFWGAERLSGRTACAPPPDALLVDYTAGVADEM